MSNNCAGAAAHHMHSEATSRPAIPQKNYAYFGNHPMVVATLLAEACEAERGGSLTTVSTPWPGQVSG